MHNIFELHLFFNKLNLINLMPLAIFFLVLNINLKKDHLNNNTKMESYAICS